MTHAHRRIAIVARWQSIELERRPDHQPRYSPTEAALRSGISVQTLTRYERLGLLTGTPEASGAHRFSDMDIDRLRRLRRLMVDLDVNLAAAEIILHMRDQIVELQRDIAMLLVQDEVDTAH